MSNAMHKLKMTTETLRDAVSKRLFDLSDLSSVESDFKASNTPPTEGYSPEAFCRNSYSHYWIHGSFDTPSAQNGIEYYLEIDTGVQGWDATNPQSIIYLNGKMAHGIDVNHKHILLDPDTHYDMYNYCYTGEHSDFKVRHSVIAVYTAVEELYYDMLVPYEACRDVYAERSREFADTTRVLEECANIIDFRTIGSAAFFESVDRALAYIKSEYYGKMCSTEGKPTVNCIGHTHIDVEWRWDRRVTRDKIQTSASTVVALMKKYPEYKFMLSQPELYRYLKESAPEKFAEVQQLAKAGRWEPEGAMFVECDCNLSSGESIVRQVLYGKKFFKNEFGTENHVLFLPDVFGYSAAMPQILKKSGVDYFITSKISWNDTNTLPYDTFMWQGIDGTEIFSAFITGQKIPKGGNPGRRTTYVGNNDPAFIYGTYERQQQKAYTSAALNTYGFGDGGGGPTKEMIEKLRRLMKGLPGLPVAKSEFIYPYMKELEAEFSENAKKLRKMPKWIGELYLEFHRGTYTTAANNKRDNRRAEFALEKCEALCVTDMLSGGSYEKDAIDAAWLKVLHAQFHDILPGSSIEQVYIDSDKDYKEVFASIGAITARKLGALAKRINTDGGILVYNPLGFPRRAIIRVDGKCYVTENTVPALGYSVISHTEHKVELVLTHGYMENSLYKITLDDMGNITSIIDKSCGREVLSGSAAEIKFYEDYPHEYDAWELDRDHTTKSYYLDNAEEELISDGDRIGLRYTSSYMASTVIKTVWIYNGSPRIDIDMRVDWKERHQVMKLHFPVDIHAASASFEIQYGHTSRPTSRNTSWEEAKFEVCAHKWVDISECGYGVAVMNDSKYGHSVNENLITVTCLRGPAWPNPNADLGEHNFTVSILPHKGSLQDANVINEAYCLNQPAEVLEIDKSCGALPENYSLVSVEEASVIIEGVKRAEDNDDVIVRLYEAHGGKTTAHIHLGEKFQKAYLTDLTETPIKELPICDGTVELPIKNFAIETLRLVK